MDKEPEGISYLRFSRLSIIRVFAVFVFAADNKANFSLGDAQILINKANLFFEAEDIAQVDFDDLKCS